MLLVLAWTSAVFAAPFDTWQWRNPLPHGSGLLSLTSGPVGGVETLVAVGEGGLIMTSAGGPWALGNSGTQNVLRDVVFGNGIFSAVGDMGTILTSPDGNTWTARTSGTTQPLRGVAHGNGRFVAVGNSTNFVSTDGISWTPGSLDANRAATLNAVAFGNGVFVAVGSLPRFGPRTPLILSSSDGLAWSGATLPNPPADADLRGVTFANGQFVVVGGGFLSLIYTSPDGTTWTQQTHAAGALYSVASGNGRYAAVGLSGGQGIPIASPDGVKWTNGFPPLSLGREPRVAFGGGKFFLLGAGGIIHESTDGLKYSPPALAYRGEFWDVLWHNGLYVAVGDIDGITGFDSSIFTSRNGLIWSPAAGFARLEFRAVAHGNGKFVAVGLHNSIMTSADGINWDLPTQPTGADFWGLTFGNGLFVGVGENGTIATSTDAITWTPRTSGVTDVLYGVAYGNGVFAAVGAPQFGFTSGVTVTSPDGITWTPVTWAAGSNPAPTAPLRGISYFPAQGGADAEGEGQFVAVGFNGQVRLSSDGRNWDARTVNPANRLAALKKITRAGNTYLVVGHGGLILSSPDLQQWQVLPSGTFNDLNGIATDGTSVVAAGLWGTILQAGSPAPVTGGAAPKITGVSVNAAGEVAVQFATESGRVYRLQASENLSTWQTIASVTGDGASKTLVDPLAAGFRFRFYRVLAE